MLRQYSFEDDRLVLRDGDATDGASFVWLDLFNPSAGEDKRVEAMAGLSVPTREDMDEIEFSARLYQEDGGEFMTITTLTSLDDDDPVKSPVTFILKEKLLITVRYIDPKPFVTVTSRAQKAGGIPCANGEAIMLALLEAIVDRLADVLERVGDDIDRVSREVFRGKNPNVTKKTRNLQSLIEQIGRKGDLLTMTQESLVSITRLATYHSASDTSAPAHKKEARQRLKLLLRDVASLSEHAGSLSGKITFLLDATLGLINLEQNQIIKIFSVASVVFLPPTLVASIYGMNYQYMPELKWALGYPFAIGLMVLSAALPFLYFKRKGWL